MDNNKYYELHVTVSPERFLEFQRFCTDLSFKPLHIRLDHGKFDEQLMLAAEAMLPDDTAARQWANDVSRVVGDRFTVVRTKLESRLVEGPNEYYEAHWKLDYGFDPEQWDKDVRALLGKLDFGLLLSHNMYDSRIHYLSQRIYNSSDPLNASRTFNLSGIAISYGGMPLKKVHYERCVYDSNPALDTGWAI